MNEENITVAKAVRKVVLKHPSIIDSLVLGVGNYSQICRYIYDEVVAELGGLNPTLYAMKMALKRFVEELRKSKEINEENISNVISNSQLEMINDVILFTFRRKFFSEIFTSVLRELGEGHFIHFTQGKRAVTVVMDRVAYNKVHRYIKSEFLIETLKDQSAVILVSPHEIIYTPGVVNYITSTLYYNGINITQIISSYVDTIIIVDKKDGVKTYSLIENIIMRFRKGER